MRRSAVKAGLAPPADKESLHFTSCYPGVNDGSVTSQCYE